MEVQELLQALRSKGVVPGTKLDHSKYQTSKEVIEVLKGKSWFELCSFCTTNDLQLFYYQLFEKNPLEKTKRWLAQQLFTKVKQEVTNGKETA